MQIQQLLYYVRLLKLHHNYINFRIQALKNWREEKEGNEPVSKSGS